MAFLGDEEAVRAALPGIVLPTTPADPVPLALLGEASALGGSDEHRRQLLACLTPLEDMELYSSGLGYSYEGPMRSRPTAKG
jgi:hypothetical protein